MNLNQCKLSKSEWESIELPVSDNEKQILTLIVKGYSNVNIRINHNLSILGFLKVEYSEKMEDYIYNKYFRKVATNIEDKLHTIGKATYLKHLKIDANIKPNSSDRVRLELFDDATIQHADIYEEVLLEFIQQLLDNYTLLIEKTNKNFAYQFHKNYYTLYKLAKNNIENLNRHVKKLTEHVLDIFVDEIDKLVLIENATEIIERNDKLLKYDDLVLYEHQKAIFTSIKTNTPKLVLYMAPTGTGKTLTPIAISEQKRIIFVCAARHVGLALARAAIAVNKKVAFAFGCSSSADIRLHYFAAKEFTLNKRSGGIGKVDNSAGENVNIIICDIRSYLIAMYYMLAFFPANDIVTYWDEPTITMDYQEHELHKIIKQNWRDNIIPCVVLSSATLPKQNELTETIPDFLNKFPGAEICNIVSHDCKKSIPIINKDGYVVLPHYLSSDYDKIKQIASHCSEYLTILRYLDLKEVVEFIIYINKNEYANNKMCIDLHFEDLNSINMKNIKKYYIDTLLNIQPSFWPAIYAHFELSRRPRILENITVDVKGAKIQKIRSLGPGVSISNKNLLAGTPITKLASEQLISNIEQPKGSCGVYITTKDAYTLSDGPTIFIADDIEKIAKFCVQQANIPPAVMEDLMKKIEFNNVINKKIYDIDVQIDEIKEGIEKQVKNNVNECHKGLVVKSRDKSNKDPRKLSKDVPEELQNKGALNKLTQEINNLRALIKRTVLNETFIPNKKPHLEKWAPDATITNAFTSSIDEQIMVDIMALNGVDNLWKILLMMGIGVFISHDNITYTEIMKKLADEQKLYMIIASSDYIYGTNYQFCHGFLSKGLKLTQEKIIQAMGRIGRNNIQQTYTVRFRDDTQIDKLFTKDIDKPEVINMNLLFNSLNMSYINGDYIEVNET